MEGTLVAQVKSWLRQPINASTCGSGLRPPPPAPRPSQAALPPQILGPEDGSGTDRAACKSGHCLFPSNQGPEVRWAGFSSLLLPFLCDIRRGFFICAMAI